MNYCFRKIFSLLVFISLANQLSSQELNCKVDVVSDKISGTDKHIFEVLQTAIYEFMNNRKWTNDIFKNEERIECNFLINITERQSTDRFKGTLQVSARRPIYKSSYNSPLLNYDDKEFEFSYLENQTLDFNETSFSSNLTSILAYYAYIIIGLDYDSFSLNGGTANLQKALSIVNNAQNVQESGWKAFGTTKNRYWLINNMLDASFIPLRECMYNYHRNGFDMMADNVQAGRAQVLTSIESLKKIHQAKPLSFNMTVFFIAKADEIINLFSAGFPDEKAKIINTLNEIDPTNSNKYLKIQNQ